MALPILGYWDIRGFAQPIRLMLEYIGIKFEDKEYSCGPAPDFDRSDWLKVKYTLGLDFPNLPYYIDGDVKLSQSVCIMRYIGMKHMPSLCGVTLEEKTRVDMLSEEIADFRRGFTGLCYNPDFENLKDDFLKALPDKLKAFEAFLGDNEWFSGGDISFADFMFYETLDHHKKLAPEVVAGHKKLVEYLKRFEALPKIKEFMSSDRFKERPMNNKRAVFR